MIFLGKIGMKCRTQSDKDQAEEANLFINMYVDGKIKVDECMK